jgi:hypothetical protein
MGFNILLRRQLRETILAHSLTHREANHAVDQLAKNSCTLTHTERLTMQLRETILAWILPPAALPIALPAAVTVGGVREAAEIRSGCSRPVPSAVELVGTPSSMKTISVAAKIFKRLVTSGHHGDPLKINLSI